MFLGCLSVSYDYGSIKGTNWLISKGMCVLFFLMFLIAVAHNKKEIRINKIKVWLSYKNGLLSIKKSLFKKNKKYLLTKKKGLFKHTKQTHGKEPCQIVTANG